MTTKNLDKYVSKDFIDSLQSIGVKGLTTLKDIFIFRDLNFLFLVFSFVQQNRRENHNISMFVLCLGKSVWLVCFEVKCGVKRVTGLTAGDKIDSPRCP